MRDQLAAWRQGVDEAPVPSIVFTDDVDFRAEIRVVFSGGMQVSTLMLPPPHVRRPAPLIRCGDPEMYQIAVCLRQRKALSRGPNSGRGAPGDLAIHDSSHQYEADTSAGPDRAEAVIAHVPRAALPFPAERLDQLVGREVPGTSGLAAILASFLTTLACRSEELSPADLARLDSVSLDLITAYLAQQLDLPRAVPSDRREPALLPGIYAFIEAHLGDAELTPQHVADANHISVRYLHRLFQRDGRSVATWIRTRRLDHCRRDLENARLDDQPVYAIGARWGLNSASDFNRAYRSAYGVPPGEWRRIAQRRRLCVDG